MGFKHSKRSHKPTVVRGSFFPIWGGWYTYFWLAWLWLPASLPRNVHPQFVEKTLFSTCCSWHLAWATLPRLSSHHQTSIVFWRIQVILVSLSNKVQTQWTFLHLKYTFSFDETNYNTATSVDWKCSSFKSQLPLFQKTKIIGLNWGL